MRQPTGRRQAADVTERRRPYLVVSSDVWNVVVTVFRDLLADRIARISEAKLREVDIALQTYLAIGLPPS